MKLSKRIRKSSIVFTRNFLSMPGGDQTDLIMTGMITSSVLFIPIFILIGMIICSPALSFKNDFTWANLYITFIYSSAIELTMGAAAILWFKGICILYHHIYYCLRVAWHETSARGIAQKLLK